jgi:hypothetical protein
MFYALPRRFLYEVVALIRLDPKANHLPANGGNQILVRTNSFSQGQCLRGA